MPNGSNIFGGIDGSQPVISVKSFVNDSIYYLFTVGDNNWYSGGMCYSMLDMRLNSGYGDIVATAKNIPIAGLQDARLTLTGTRHRNNHDVWIVTSIFNPTQQYCAFLYTDAGISTNLIFSPSLMGNAPISGMRFFLKFAPDGKKYIMGAFNMDQAEFGLFNNQTGSFNPLFLFKVVHGLDTLAVDRFEFSPDSKKLYATGFLPVSPLIDSLFLYQFDATKSTYIDFMQSMIEIGNCENRGHNSLQIAPDRKIYMARLQDTMISVINYPNLPGTACGFQKRTIGLSGRYSTQALPQFIQKYFVYVNFQDACIGDTIKFSSSIWPPADTIQWTFGDPLSGSFNYSTLPNPAHYYSAPGSYSVSLYVRHNDNRTDTVWKTVNVYSYPAPNLGPNRSICIGDSITFDAGFCNGCTYSWSNLSTNQTNIATGQTFKTGQAGIYKVDVLNVKCSGSDTVQLVTTPVPQVNNTQLTKSVCSGESTNIPLSSNVPGTLFHWTASLTSGTVTGFSADSGLVINQVLTNTLPSAGVVTYSVTPKVGSCTGTPVDFTVTVNPGDSAKVSISASVNNVCSGTPVSFTAIPTNPGASPMYQWKVNGVNAGGNSPVYSYAPANGDQVQCTLTSSLTVCISNNPATSNTISMSVNPLLPVGVTVSASGNNVCAGTPVTFSAAAVNGGSVPSYQWKVNGIPVGTNSPVYTYVPLNNDAVVCSLTSSEACTAGNPATSPAVTMIVNPQLPVSVSISASINPFCIGTPVSFTASPANGGPAAVYQWKVNGSNAGGNAPVFTYNPVSGDAVTCLLTSSLQCVSGNPALSNSVTLTGNPGLPASVAIAANPNPFCPGTPAVFTAAPGNGGTTPVYQWKVNGINAGSNSPSFTYNPSDNDSVRCVMTSNLVCVSSNPAVSNKIVMSGSLAPPVSLGLCFDSITTVGAKPFKLKGGLPLGGTWSGPGVNSLTGVFNPASAGTGLKTIVYSYTNVYLCSASKTKSITVQPNAVFTCGNTLTDIRDNKSYPTVQIGTQCWMAANLNRGAQIISSQVQFDNCLDEKYCYGNDPAKCSKYGGLYQWDEMMRYDDAPAGQGLCPPGWHIPTDNDWTVLCNFYNGNGFAGKPLQDTIVSGFRALTGGVFYLNSSWSFADFAVLFWTSTPWGPAKAVSHGLNIYDFSVSLYPSSRANAFPIRCLKD